jgi:hypothetical protein
MPTFHLSEPEKAAIEAAARAFSFRGIEFNLPWNGDLDDLEQERFAALLIACRSYKSQLEK